MEKIINVFKQLGLNFINEKINITESNEFRVSKTNNEIFVNYSNINDLYQAALIINSLNDEESYNVKINKQFKRLGMMLDCSRNATHSVKALKKYLNYLAMSGYNTLYLYMEDVYELPDNPIFGYLRGKYSKSDLQEIDDYAFNLGIEVIPCIQTLAHIGLSKRWNHMCDLYDCNDILLCGDENVYKLIESMVKYFSVVFRSREIHLGMDEAIFMGLGNYLYQHGFVNREKIFLDHLSRVVSICDKYNMNPSIWGDMIFRFLNNGEYYTSNKDFNLSKEVVEKVPPNVKLYYWDYYYNDKNRYDAMLKAYKMLPNDIAYAGGVWTWNGFAPCNTFALDSIDAAYDAVVKYNIEDVMFTSWGDDGAETSIFAALPAIFHAGLKYTGIDLNLQNKLFKTMTGIDFNEFMKLDLPDQLVHEEGNNKPINTSKYSLYNDLFHGYIDFIIDDKYRNKFLDVKNELNKYSSNKEFGYIFKNLSVLCDLLYTKYDLGKRIHTAYDNKDFKQLKKLIKEIDLLICKTNKFYQVFKKQWYEENKLFGFDVQDIRFGGLIKRFKSCKELLVLYTKHKIEKIEELEQKLIYGALEGATKDNFLVNMWKEIVTPNYM